MKAAPAAVRMPFERFAGEKISAWGAENRQVFPIPTVLPRTKVPPTRAS